LEEQKHYPVDSQHRPWALVAHNLSPCLFKQEYPMALAATNGNQSESMLVPKIVCSTYQKKLQSSPECQ
jgi:hypothetical protein